MPTTTSTARICAGSCRSCEDACDALLTVV
jgi:hypothetical protein